MSLTYPRHERTYKTLQQDKIGMIHAASILTVFWTDVLRGSQCTYYVAEMRTSLCCSCELAVTVKVTPKKCTWMSAVAVTSRQISKSLAEQSRSRHLNVHHMTCNHTNLVESHGQHIYCSQVCAFTTDALRFRNPFNVRIRT